MFNRNKLKKVFYIEKESNFWSYEDACSFFHDIAKDLTCEELEKLVDIMKLRLSVKKSLIQGAGKNV